MSKKLGELCRITSSKRIFKSEYVENGIPFIRGQEISDGSINNKNAKFKCYISEKRYNEIKAQYGVSKLNDILITAVGTIGNICIINREFDFYFKDGNVIRFTDFADEVYPEYLYHFMKSSLFKKQLKYSMIGAVQKALTMVMLNKIELDLPPLSTQQKIAKVLSTIDEKIELNNKINTELETLAKTIYDYWFVQFEFPDENGKPYKSNGGEMEYNEQLKREIPVGWSDGNLTDIANILMGQSPSGDSYNENGDGTVFFQGRTDFGDRFPSVRMFTTLPSRIAKQGEILLSVRAPVGDINIASEECCIGRGLSALNSKTNHNSYLFYLMLKLRPLFDDYNGSGTTFGAINKDTLHDIKTLIPKTETLDIFEEIVSKVDKQIYKNSMENQQLTALRDWLLPMLMNGQATVE